MIGLLLAGSGLLGLHRTGAALPRLWRGDGGGAASLPNIVVRLFGVEALWVACVIGYLACFASLNIYIQSFARLVWSQAQHKRHTATSQGCPPRQIPRNALNARAGILRS